jgi:hypothetical protein
MPYSCSASLSARVRCQNSIPQAHLPWLASSIDDTIVGRPGTNVPIVVAFGVAASKRVQRFGTEILRVAQPIVSTHGGVRYEDEGFQGSGQFLAARLPWD